MTTTTQPQFPSFTRDPENIFVRCYGANHTDAAQLGTCDACGRDVARREGRRTLYSVFTRGAWAARTYACWAVHTCNADDVTSYDRVKADKLAAGQIIKGARVVVVRGRKVPRGTEGVVIWTGRDAWDNDRIGIRDDEGTTHWTAMKNAELAP